METPKDEIRRKMADLYKTLTSEHYIDKFEKGNVMHLSLKREGPYELWFEEAKPANVRTDKLKEAEEIIRLAVGSITPYEGTNGLATLNKAVEYYNKYLKEHG